jgi:O-acetylserine/cysteine efflux transporter
MSARHTAVAVLIAAVWGVNFVIIHLGLEHFPPLLFSALRFTFVALPAVFLVGSPRVRWYWVVAVGGSLGVLSFGLLFVGIDQGMPAGLSSLVLQTQVIFTVAFAVPFLGERPERTQFAGAAIALVGLAVIAVDRAASAPLLPFALVIGAAAAWGVSNVCTRLAQPPDGLALMVWASLVAPLPLLTLSFAFDGPGQIGDALRGVDLGGIGALAYIVGPSTLFGFAAWSGLLRRYPAAVVAPFTLLVPIFGIAAAAIVLGERPSVAELGGAVLIVAGLLYGLRRQSGVRDELQQRAVGVAEVDARPGAPAAVAGDRPLLDVDAARA